MYRVYVPDVPRAAPAREISKSLNTSDQHAMVFADFNRKEKHMTLEQSLNVIMSICMIFQTLRVFGII